MKKEVEIVEIKAPKQMWLLKKLLGIKKHKCYYCKTHIKEGDKFGIFNKPTRLICISIVCLSQAIEEEEKYEKERNKNRRT